MADTHYDKVSLLLPMSGANNETVFTDWAAPPKTVTVVGDAKTVTTQSKHYGSSGYFDGTGDYLSLSDSAAWNPGAGDFTVEAYCYFNNIPTTSGVLRTVAAKDDVLDTGNRGWLLAVSGTISGKAYGRFAVGGTNYEATSDSALVVSTWYHLALVRHGSTVALFVDGVQQATTASIGSGSVNAPSRSLTIGAYTSSGSPVNLLNGYLQDLRVTKGVARYTADFTPPTRLIGEISGTITDDAGAAAIRKIVAFPRAAPLRTFTTDSASDGTYTLQAPATEHSRIVMDDDAGILYNDLIDRVIPE